MHAILIGLSVVLVHCFGIAAEEVPIDKLSLLVKLTSLRSVSKSTLVKSQILISQSSLD